MFFLASSLPTGVLVYWVVTNVTSIIHQKRQASKLAVDGPPLSTSPDSSVLPSPKASEPEVLDAEVVDDNPKGT